MFGFIKGLFGSQKNVDTVIETGAKGLYNGIDKLFYTDEEKAEASADILKLKTTAFQKFVDAAYDQNSIRSITRRWLAFLVMGPTILFYVLAAVFHGIGVFAEVDKSGLNGFITYASFLFAMANTLAPWAGGVLIFYFGPHLIGAFNGKKK